jgi:hypothetical protein
LSNTWILGLAAIATASYYGWAFRTLAGEHWQVLATLPRRRDEHGEWRGVNFTWYGALTANAYVIAVAAFLVLMTTLETSLRPLLIVVGGTLAICVPASRWMSRVIDRKPFGFTVAGAYTVGAVVMPPLALMCNAVMGEAVIPIAPLLAAAGVAFVLGEGIGRLACISFGCCYGVPLKDCPALVRRLLGKRSFSFTGPTKKASYEGRLEGVPLVPIQAITTVVLTLTAFAAGMLFLGGWYRASFVLSVVLSHHRVSMDGARAGRLQHRRGLRALGRCGAGARAFRGIGNVLDAGAAVSTAGVVGRDLPLYRPQTNHGRDSPPARLPGSHLVPSSLCENQREQLFRSGREARRLERFLLAQTSAARHASGHAATGERSARAGALRPYDAGSTAGDR